MSRLITASLISSVDWFRKSPPSWKQRAFDDLKNTLGRVYGEMPIFVKKGIQFENDVYGMLENGVNYDSLEASDEFKEFLTTCEGGEFQNKNKMFIDIAGEEYCLYAKEDAFFKKGSERYPNGHIIDIKTAKKWGGKAKYLNTYQHKLYCLIEKIPTFNYIVGVWEDPEGDSRKLESVHSVDYLVEDFKLLKEDIVEKVSDTINYLQADEELWNLYLDKFCLY